MTNPERLVIEEIDRLEAEWAAQDEIIDQTLVPANRDFDDYSRSWHDRSGDLTCPVCLGEWHGLHSGNCPGAYATEDEKRVYHARRAQRTTIDVSHRRHRPSPQHMVEFGPFEIGTSDAIPPGQILVMATPQMQTALVDHVQLHPEDTDVLMRRFRSLIFAPDGRPVPWTPEGLHVVLAGNQTHISWARRQLGVVDLGTVGESGVE